MSGVENDGADCNNIVFVVFVIEKQNYMFVTLLTKYNQKLSKLLSKGFERSVYWNEYKTKSQNKNATKEYRYFIESKFVGLFFWHYSNQHDNTKTCY